MEKLAFTLVTTVKRLRPYFQAHPIIVFTNEPLRAVLQKLEVLGRMVKWAIKLGKYDMNYRLRTAIKGHVLIDFLAELTPVKTERSSSKIKWTLHVDRSSTTSSSNARLLLTTPVGLEVKYAIRLGFNRMNNEAEYEALITGLSLAKEAGAVHVTAYTDSKLVKGQVIGEYEAKEDRMKKNTWLRSLSLCPTLRLSMSSTSLEVRTNRQTN